MIDHLSKMEKRNEKKKKGGQNLQKIGLVKIQYKVFCSVIFSINLINFFFARRGISTVTKLGCKTNSGILRFYCQSKCQSICPTLMLKRTGLLSCLSPSINLHANFSNLFNEIHKYENYKSD